MKQSKTICHSRLWDVSHLSAWGWTCRRPCCCGQTWSCARNRDGTWARVTSGFFEHGMQQQQWWGRAPKLMHFLIALRQSHTHTNLHGSHAKKETKKTSKTNKEPNKVANKEAIKETTSKQSQTHLSPLFSRRWIEALAEPKEASHPVANRQRRSRLLGPWGS